MLINMRVSLLRWTNRHHAASYRAPANGPSLRGLVVTGSWLDLNDDGDNRPDLQADLTRIPRRPPCTGGGNADAQYQAPLTVPCHDTEPIASRTWVSVKGGWYKL